MFQLKIKELEKNKKFKYKHREVYLKKKFRKWSKTLRPIKRQIKKKRNCRCKKPSRQFSFFNRKKFKKEHGDKVSAEEKKSIENGIADLKKSLEGTDVEDIKKKTQSLIQVSMKLGEAVYKSQQKPNNKDKGAGGPKNANLTKKIM